MQTLGHFFEPLYGTIQLLPTGELDMQHIPWTWYSPKPYTGLQQQSRQHIIGSNPVQEIHTKHIDIKYHYMHECIAEKKIDMFFIPSEQNTADLFTKNLNHLKFEKFRA